MSKIFFIPFVMILFGGILLGCGVKKETTKEQTASLLPDITLLPEEGEKYSTNKLPGNTILIFFSSECDHCQREAAEISNSIDKFAAYKIYFISMDGYDVMQKFASEYRLVDRPNLVFIRAEGKSVLDALGDVSTPTICIYNQQRQLVKRFDGETEIGVILEFL